MLCGKINYESLEIYSLAHAFVLHVYTLSSSFPAEESNNLTSQLRRAATCLPLNIAEGSGAGSFRVFFNYLTFCYRSCLETEAALRICKDLNYITEAQYQDILEKLDMLIRKLYKYMQYIEEKADSQKLKKSTYYLQQREEIAANVQKREEMNALS